MTTTKEVIELLNNKYELEEKQKVDYRKMLKIKGKRTIRGRQIGIIEKRIHSKVMELNRNE